MNPISRGIRNAFRNTIRTFSIVIILGISVGLSLSMLVARQAVQEKINTVKGSIGNTITISPAGIRGFEGGGEALTSTQIASVRTIANVTNVNASLSDRVTSANTSLQSSIEAGSFGNRAQRNSGVGFDSPANNDTPNRANPPSSTGQSQATRTFTPPVTITGISDSSSDSVYGGDSVTFTSGQAFDASKDADVAVVGQSIASKNNLSVGSTFSAYGKDVKVVGIFNSGNTFANNGVYMPLVALQRLSGQTEAVTNAIVTVNSIDNIDSVVTAIKSALGTKADVVSNQATAKTAVEPLESVKTISTYSLIGALGAGAIIILLTMMMIVRERRREIGVMKAIGSSNAKTISQFVTEAITLTCLGLIVGTIIGIVSAQPITKALVNNSNNSNSTTQRSPGDRPGRPDRATNVALRSVRNVQADVGLDTIAYGVGIALLIAIIGSAVPAYVISKVRPAEVMRAE